MRREFEFLERVLRAYVARGGPRPVAPTGLDWEAVQQISMLHGLLPTVAPTLLDAGPPEAIAASLRSNATRLRRRSALLQLELERLYPRLDEAGCEPLVIKGPAITHRYYADPTERFFADIDLLVPPERLDRAVEIARTFGYGSEKSPRTDSFYRGRHFHYHLIGEIGAVVELHWDLTRPGDYVRFDVPGIFRRARTVRMGDIEARIPEACDQLLHVASQMAMDGFFELRRIVDAARILGSGEVGTDLVPRARDQGLATTTWLLLELVHGTLGVDGPAGVRDGLEPPASIARSIRALDPKANLFTMFALEHRGYRSLLRWLCAPDTASRRREIRTFLGGSPPPDTPEGDGAVGTRAPLGKRMWRLWVFAKIYAYLGWKRLTHVVRSA